MREVGWGKNIGRNKGTEKAIRLRLFPKLVPLICAEEQLELTRSLGFFTKTTCLGRRKSGKTKGSVRGQRTLGVYMQFSDSPYRAIMIYTHTV